MATRFIMITGPSLCDGQQNLHGFRLDVVIFSLIPRPSIPPVFDCLQYAKTEEEGLGNHVTWFAAQPSYAIMTPLNSQVMQLWNWSCILCQLWRWDKCQQRAAPSVWNISRLKAMTSKGCWVSRKYPAMMQPSCRVKRWHYLELHHLYHTHPKLQTQIYFYR